MGERHHVVDVAGAVKFLTVGIAGFVEEPAGLLSVGGKANEVVVGKGVSVVRRLGAVSQFVDKEVDAAAGLRVEVCSGR